MLFARARTRCHRPETGDFRIVAVRTVVTSVFPRSARPNTPIARAAFDVDTPAASIVVRILILPVDQADLRVGRLKDVHQQRACTYAVGADDRLLGTST